MKDPAPTDPGRGPRRSGGRSSAPSRAPVRKSTSESGKRWRGGHDSAVAETRRDNLIYALAHALQDLRAWVRLGQHNSPTARSRTYCELVRNRRLVRLSRKRVICSAARGASRHARWAYYCNACLRRRARRLWSTNFCAVRSGHVRAAGLFLLPRRRTHETGQRWRLGRAHEARQRRCYALVVGVVLLHHSSPQAPAVLELRGAQTVLKAGATSPGHTYVSPPQRWYPTEVHSRACDFAMLAYRNVLAQGCTSTLSPESLTKQTLTRRRHSVKRAVLVSGVRTSVSCAVTCIA